MTARSIRAATPNVTSSSAIDIATVSPGLFRAQRSEGKYVRWIAQFIAFVARILSQ